MKGWRAPSPDPFCGKCGRLLAKDEPVLVITMRGLARELVRCTGCAGEPVNYAQVEAGPTSSAVSTRADVMQRLSEIMPDRFDGRMAAAGRDE